MPPGFVRAEFIDRKEHLESVPADELAYPIAEQVFCGGIHFEEVCIGVELHDRDRRTFGEQDQLATRCLHLAASVQQLLELLVDLRRHLIVLAHDARVVFSGPEGRGEDFVEPVGQRDVRQVEQGHQHGQLGKLAIAKGGQYIGEGKHGARGEEGVGPPHRGKYRDAAGGHSRQNESEKYLLNVAMRREEHRTGDSPVHSRRQGANRDPAQPFLLVPI